MAKRIRKISYVRCRGGSPLLEGIDRASLPGNCSEILQLFPDGINKCRYGCLGFGECVSVCKFDAISLVDGIAVVDPEKCVACGLCVKACPRHLISLVPKTKDHHIACSSKDKGLDVKKQCPAGCLACTMCEKQCPVDAIRMENNLPVIDYSKCVNCGACAVKCPVKCISGLETLKAD